MKNLSTPFLKGLIIFSLILFSTLISFGQSVEELLEQASTQYDESKYEQMLETAEKVLTLDAISCTLGKFGYHLCYRK